MSLLSPLKNPITLVLVVAIAVLLAASLSQTVESAGSATQTKSRGVIRVQEEPAKSRRFPNVDIRTTEPQTMAAIASANASNITQRLKSRKISVEQALTRLRTFSGGVQSYA